MSKITNKLHSNKCVQTGAFILATLLLGFFVYIGLTMADPGTGSLAGVNFNPKQVTIAGLSIGTIWVIARVLTGSNFKGYEMPKPVVILWCVLILVGALVFWTLRLPNDGRYSIGTVIFVSGALLPLLLYDVLGIAVNRASHRIK